MEFKIDVHNLSIKDEKTGEVLAVTTLRSAKEIAEYIEESEGKELPSRVEKIISEYYAQRDNN